MPIAILHPRHDQYRIDLDVLINLADSAEHVEVGVAAQITVVYARTGDDCRTGDDTALRASRHFKRYEARINDPDTLSAFGISQQELWSLAQLR